MSKYPIDAVLNALRRDGSVIVATTDFGDANVWRQQLRRACRVAGLRVRTGVSDNAMVWVHHVDHVVTDAEHRAANRAVSNLLSGQPLVPFHELVRKEQRKRFTVVDGTETP